MGKYIGHCWAIHWALWAIHWALWAIHWALWDNKRWKKEGNITRCAQLKWAIWWKMDLFRTEEGLLGAKIGLFGADVGLQRAKMGLIGAQMGLNLGNGPSQG